MIATGIDGLSRGDQESGIALGYDLRTFLPLDCSAFDTPTTLWKNGAKAGWGLITPLQLPLLNGS